MENLIVRTETMRHLAAQLEYVLLETSSAKMETAHFQFQFVMELTIVEMVLMR